jgi:NhaA family Na+:H+ antiporter
MTRRVVKFVLENSLLLVAGAVAALIWANVDPESYDHLIHLRFLGTDFHYFTNEILMTFFFGLAGKEIWEAMLPRGPLHEPRRAMTPIVATLGGMAAPALLYTIGAIWLGRFDDFKRGWAIPCATDIAFSYMIARVVFGRRHPAIPFLLLLAIGDDFGGLIILAICFPAASIQPLWLFLPVAAVGLGLLLRSRHVQGWWWYIFGPGVLSWIGFKYGGLQPALGLLPIIPTLPHSIEHAGQANPLTPRTRHALHLFEHHLRRPVEVVLGLFGLMNAGVALHSIGAATALVTIALVIGKPLGIWLAGALTAKVFKCGLPEGMTMKDLLVLGFAAGIGFTVALFVAQIAFPAGDTQNAARMGALGSIIAVAPTLVVARLMNTQRRHDA